MVHQGILLGYMVSHKMRKYRPLFISFVTFCSILGVSAMVIAYGRGYRLDIKQSSLKPTGLLSTISDPVGAQVFIEGKLKTATNNSVAIEPGWYTVTISKEGYISWQKKIRVQGEVVSKTDAVLFPSNPSLSPLTNLGVERPILSPDGSKIAYTVPIDHLDDSLQKKAGLWVYTLSEGPLGRNRDPIQIAPFTDGIDIQKASIVWSPDSTQLLVHNAIIYHLYQINRQGTYTDVTLTHEALLADWTGEKDIKEHQKLEVFNPQIIDIATSSARIISFSPDETKILYEATTSATLPIAINPPLIGTNPTQEERSILPGKIYVYDGKEDKNYLLLDTKEIKLPAPTPTPTTIKNTIRQIQKPVVAPPVRIDEFIHWFPTSRHIILTLQGKIDILEYDRTNWATIYSGPFVDGFVAPWSNGSRVIIMTNLNGNAATLPNLYTVNLR